MGAPRGTLQGFPVVWRKRDVSGSKNVTSYTAPYRLQQDSVDMGPGATKHTLEFYIEPPDMDVLARNLKDLTDELNFAVVTDPYNIYFDDGHAFVRVPGVPFTRMGPRLTTGYVDATYVGNNQTHRLEVVATSRQLTNVWALPTRTAIHVPLATTLETAAFTDAARRVVIDPGVFATANANYTADLSTRNGGTGVLAHILTPSTFLQDAIRAVLFTKDRYGVGLELNQATLRSPAQDAVLDAGSDTIVVKDRLGVAGAADKTISFPNGYARVSHGNSEFAAHPERHVVLFDNGATLILYANGNLQLRPGGAAFKVPGGATRALGTGVFYHPIGGSAYLTGTGDFTVAADGTIGYGAITYGAELVVNGTFATYTTSPGVPDSWTSDGGAGVVFTKETSIVHGGSNAVKITAGGASNQGMRQDLPALTAGTQYFVEGYGRTSGAASEAAQIRVRNITDAVDVLTLTGTTSITRWERLAGSFTAVAGKSYRVYFEHATAAATRIIYGDDISVKAFVSQAGTGDVDATFGLVHTAAVGSALVDRLRELLGDLLPDYFLGAR